MLISCGKNKSLGGNALDNRLRPESKKHIIRCAYKVLQRDGAADFSVRQVAHECGCSVSGLYRHFSGREELLLYASLLCLEPYFKELSELVYSKQNSISSYFRVEQLFASYSFSQPDLFYTIYFGSSEASFDRVLRDSYSLFESSPEKILEYRLGQGFVEGGIEGRNLAMLETCLKDGFLNINHDELVIFNKGIVTMYRGFLDTAIVMKRQGKNVSALREQYLQAHSLMHKKILSPDAYIYI